MKRIITMVLAMVLVISLLPAGALKAEAATGGKLIALTFDDGPSSKYTEQLLDGLKARGVQVTFFVLGQLAEDYPEIVRRAYEEGHEIASHTYDHEDLADLTESQIRSEVSKTEAILDEICGPNAEYLVRPPYGSTNDTVKSVIDVPLINWSVDTRDWEVKDADIVCENIVNDSFDGAIVLCHDIHKTTIPGALAAIDKLLEQGYEFVTVSELYRRRGEAMRNGGIHRRCDPTGTDYGDLTAPVITYSIPGNGKATITITSNSDAPIYFNTDATYPDGNAELYTGPFQVPYGITIRAVSAYKINGDRSAVTTLTVPTSSKELCATPEISLNGEGQAVMTSATPGSSIYYTLDNTAPDTEDTLYSGPVAVTPGSYIRAIAADGFHQNSSEGKGYYSDHSRLYLDMDPSKWFYDEMEKLNVMGIVNGTGDYTMSPNGKLTRGMLVTLLYRYSGEKLEEGWTATHSFTDVAAGKYYTEAVEWAYRNGIVEGYSETSFGPNRDTTRQEMCKIMDYFLTYREKPLAEGESCEDQFADYDQVASWAEDSVNAMVHAGLIVGDNQDNLRPTATTTRAEFCTVLCRVMDYEETYEPPVEEEEPSEPPFWEFPTEDTEPPAETDPTEDTESPVEDETTEDTEPPVDDETTESTEPPAVEDPSESTEPSEEAPEENTEETEEPTENT